MTDDPILEVTDLRKAFGGIQAVDGVTFDVERGSITGLIGPNGAGKTTTFNLVSGFLAPDGGSIRFDGTDIQDHMRPGRDESRIWTGAGAVTFGMLGLGAASVAGFSPVQTAGAVAVGAGIGVGGYYAQEHLKQSVGVPSTRPYRMAHHGLSRTFQLTRELRGLTVFENLLLAPSGQRGEQLTNVWFRPSVVDTDERRVRSQAEEILELLDLAHLRDEMAGNLSGGQRKLLELGRVLMTDPELVLLDEPVAGVNPTLTETLLDRIRTLREEGLTFLVVEHDMEVIMELSDRIIVMHQGTKLTEGTPEEVHQDERVLDAYLGV